MEKENFYIPLNGEKVEVSEAVYRAWIRPVRKERRRKQRAFRCQIKGPKGNLIRCQKNCNECPYALAGNNALGNNLSLDRLKDEGINIEEHHLDVEENFFEKEEKQALYDAINQLTARQQKLVQLIYFNGKSQDEVSKMLGVSKSAISHAMERIYASLRKFLEKN